MTRRSPITVTAENIDQYGRYLPSSSWQKLPGGLIYFMVLTSNFQLCFVHNTDFKGLKSRYQQDCVPFLRLVAQTVKHLPIMQETRVQSLGGEDLLEKEMATHSSILAWKIPWMVEPGRLQSKGSRLGDFTSLHF